MMTSGTSFEQRDIVLVPLPFSDLSSAKQRPALIISNDNYNSGSDDVLVCGITSNLKDADYSVILSGEDISGGALFFASRIKADKIFSLDKSIFRKKIGKLSQEKFRQVGKLIYSLIQP